MIRKPFTGATYERDRPSIDPFTKVVVGPPPRVTVLSCDVTYFGCPGILVSMPWPSTSGAPPVWRVTDEVKFNLEDFVRQFHPVDNVVQFGSR